MDARGQQLVLLVGGELVTRSVRDKVAVLSGAEVVIDLDQAGQVDPDLPAEGYPREVAAAPGDTTSAMRSTVRCWRWPFLRR